jgi:SAM-dependent methyltransferase
MPFVKDLIVPLAFDGFQFWIGGTIAKRNLVLQHLKNYERVLEIGCSTGNIASAFLNKPIQYVGLDIDNAAISYAQHKFRHQSNFVFYHAELCDCKLDNPFDYIVFSGVLHHMDDITAKRNIMLSKSLLRDNGRILVSDPLLPRESDDYLVRLYGKIERGLFLRDADHLQQLIEDLDGLTIISQHIHSVSPFPILRKPVVANFAVYVLKQRMDTSGVSASIV